MDLSAKMSETIGASEYLVNAENGNIDPLVNLDILANMRPDKNNIAGDFDYL